MPSFEYDEEFYTRVSHNFKSYVLLISKKTNWNEDDILKNICRLSGYKCHKTVKYRRYSSHIHVRFQADYLAAEAVEFLNKTNSGLSAVLVDDMLRDWFTYEIKSGIGPPCTLTIVDVIGSPPFALNFLTSSILSSIFRNFGEPYLLPYTAAINEPHVQVLFGSMTEAFAACVAFGEWCEYDRKLDSFSYRVRINASDKEASLIKNSGGVPEGAFKLDYFVNMRTEVIRSRKRLSENGQARTPQLKSSKSREIQKVREPKPPVIKTESRGNLANQIGHRTPILCVPVIAPMNYAKALATNQQLGTHFANAIMDSEHSSAISPRAITSGESRVEISSTFQKCITEETSGCHKKLYQTYLSLEQESITDSDPVQPTPLKQTSVPLKQTRSSVAKPKPARKVHTRIFESCR